MVSSFATRYHDKDALSFTSILTNCRMGFLAFKQVGLTGKEVGFYAKNRPYVIGLGGGSSAQRLVNFFLEDLQVGEVTPTIMSFSHGARALL